MLFNEVVLKAVADAKPYVKDLVSVDATTAISHALHLMAIHDFHAIPVAKSATQFICILNVFDLMNYVLDFVNLAGNDIQHERLLFEDPVENALGLSFESRLLWSFNEIDKLSLVIDAFGKNVHRVLLFDHERRHPARILTQTDVARFLLEHLRPFEANLTLRQLELFEDPSPGVVTIHQTETALRGFNRIAINDVTAVAIVDDDERLVGTLSASDIRGTTAQNIDKLLQPVIEFKKGRQHQLTANADDTLREALQRTLDAHVHRLWFLDERGRPRGVVTLSDIISKIAYFPVDFSQTTM